MPSEQTQFKPGVTKLPKTKGRFSKQEMEFIDANIKTLGLRQTARKMRRNEPAVKRAALELGIKIDDAYTDEQVEQQEIQKELRGSIEFSQLRNELSKRELKFFLERYAKHLVQFKDVTTTEQTQVFQAIKFEIFMNRHGAEIKKCMREKIRLESLLQRFFQKHKESDLDETMMQTLRDLENNLAAIRAAQGAGQVEYIKSQERHASLMKELRATRDQRVSKMDSNTENITDLIKKLRVESFRKLEGENLELVKIAVEREARKLMSLHTFVDGGVDPIILNSESAGNITTETEQKVEEKL